MVPCAPYWSLLHCSLTLLIPAEVAPCVLYTAYYLYMGFRKSLIIGGALLFFGSIWFGDFAIVLGAPLFFLGIIFKFLDVT